MDLVYETFDIFYVPKRMIHPTHRSESRNEVENLYPLVNSVGSESEEICDSRTPLLCQAQPLQATIGRLWLGVKVR